MNGKNVLSPLPDNETNKACQILPGKDIHNFRLTRRFWSRRPPVTTALVVDVLSLFRQVGSPETMVMQLRQLLDIAAMPSVTLQVMQAVEHPVNNSGVMIADNAAWCEHSAAGYVFTDPETVRRLSLRFDTFRAESYRASESTALIRRLTDIWATGVSPLTATLAADSASK